MRCCGDDRTWRKASRSTNSGQCVELAYTSDGSIDNAVRDSKNPTGPSLEGLQLGTMIRMIRTQQAR